MKKVSVTVMLPKNTVLALDDLCDRCGVPRSFIVCQMVMSSLIGLEELKNVTSIVEVLKIINGGFGGAFI